MSIIKTGEPNSVTSSQCDTNHRTYPSKTSEKTKMGSSSVWLLSWKTSVERASSGKLVALLSPFRPSGLALRVKSDLCRSWWACCKIRAWPRVLRISGITCMMMLGFTVVPVGCGWSEEYNVITSVDRNQQGKKTNNWFRTSAIGRLFCEWRKLYTP